MRISSLRHIAIVVLLFACAGCEYHGLTCWNRLQNLNNELTWLLDRPGEIDPSALADVRSRMASNVEQCRGGDFYRDFNSTAVPGEFNITLFDLAIMANDAELAADMYDRHLELSPEFREENLGLGYSHLETAVHVESAGVARWMLENGFDANRVSEMGGTPLFFSGTRTDDGLQATRDLVAYGANLEHEGGADGITPLMVAWRQGNLRKAQCLISLGAKIPEPLPTMEEPRSMFVDPYDVEQVTAFLSDTNRDIPDRIAEICSIDQ